MNLSLSQPPEKAVKAAINGFHTCRGGRQLELRLSTFGHEPELACAHPIYYLSRNELLKNAPLSRAGLVGWRFIIVANEEVIGDIEVEPIPDRTMVMTGYKTNRRPSRSKLVNSQDRTSNIGRVATSLNSGFRFTRMSTGPLVEATVKGIGLAEDNPLQAKGVLQLLRLPSIHLQMLWFKGQKSFFMPINTTLDDINKFQLYDSLEIYPAIMRHITGESSQNSELVEFDEF